MLDFDKARENMVDCQVRTCDVTNIDLLDVLQVVPRERFVDSSKAGLAYLDADISLGNDRYLMEAAPFAKLAQAASPSKTDIVLVIGSGSGYSAAVFSRLASTIIAVEPDTALRTMADKTLTGLGYDNVVFVAGDLERGHAGEAPYDVIFFDGAVERLPDAILAQLKDGGRLVVVEGRGNAAVAKLYLRSGDDISPRRLFNCSIKPLPGFRQAVEFAL